MLLIPKVFQLIFPCSQFGDGFFLPFSVGVEIVLSYIHGSVQEA